LIGHLQRLFRTTGSAQIEAVLTVDDHGRDARDFILLGQFFVLGDLALDGERVEGFQEFGLVDALGGNELGHVVRVGQALAAFLDGIEHGGVDL
nr:hypothetical protein [Tanacetum cinerariifolium]